MGSIHGAAVASSRREIRRVQRADGGAAMLAIGTANPANCVAQDDYPDYYFRVTSADHLTHLKQTFTAACRMPGIGKRFFYHTEELLNNHPDLLRRASPASLDTRLDIVAAAAPELAASAAAKAIAAWGRPATDITHLVVSTNSGAHAPSIDLRLASLLGLRRDLCRTMLHLNGCSSGCAALRLAKDLAENNRGARVLVACVELTLTAFRGPDEDDTLETLLSQAIFADGAGAVIVGAVDDDPAAADERPLFEMVSVSQTVVPGTEHMLTMQLRSGGISGSISSKTLPKLAGDSIEQCMVDAFRRLDVAVDDWNDLFWAVHPGARVILDNIGRGLRLAPEKLAASQTIVREYGNMLGATVIFVLQELRRRMDEEEGSAGGDQWGAMVGFGPGVTIETMALHSCSRRRH